MAEFHALAIKVKAKRQELGESREEFSFKCGLTEKTVYNIEHEITKPEIETVQKIAAYTGDSVAQLLEVETIS